CPFSSASYRLHLELHSFPTRRSSDLHDPLEQVERLAEVVADDRFDDVGVADQGEGALGGGGRETLAGGDSAALHVGHRLAAGKRSEEHTSELQSRENLVCRLLLEKKK